MLRLRSAAIGFTALSALSGITAGSRALASQQQWTDARLHGVGVPVLPLVQGARGGAGQDGVPKELGAGLRPRESYHLARKTFHFSTIMAFAVVYSAKLPQKDFARGMAALDACVLAGELARLRVDAVNRALFRVFGAFMRAHELKKFSGIMYCLAGLGITSTMFPKHIALLGMLQLALGDPVAALCGHATRSVGWSRVGTGKGLLGALGCAAALTLANSFVLVKATFESSGAPPPPLRRIVLAGGMIATWAAAVEVSVPSPQKTLPCEGFPLAFDDNAVLPVLSALGAAVVFSVLGLGSCELRPWLFG
ncbi:unnamed protein product [Ectocarpus fasciculatus]